MFTSDLIYELEALVALDAIPFPIVTEKQTTSLVGQEFLVLSIKLRLEYYRKRFVTHNKYFTKYIYNKMPSLVFLGTSSGVPTKARNVNFALSRIKLK